MKTIINILAWPFVTLFSVIQRLAYWTIYSIGSLVLSSIIVTKAIFGFLRDGVANTRQAAHLGIIKVKDYFAHKPLIFSGYPKPEEKTPIEVSPFFSTPHEELKDWFYKRNHRQDEKCRNVVEIIADYYEYAEDPIKHTKVAKSVKKEEIEQDFLRSHRWKLEFGSEEENNALLYSRNLRFASKPSFLKPGTLDLDLYLTPKTIDFLARKPKTRQARVVFTNGSGEMTSYVELNKVKLAEVDMSKIDFDYCKADISVVTATFSYKSHKVYGTVAVNGPMEEPIVA
tara:strand:+ start:121247 stop:122101 length:855 start_codon:yes stop_codon:yes gene_type:complete